MTRRALVLVLAVALAWQGLAWAQTALPPDRADRIIEALMIWRLVDDLALSDGQIAAIFPMIRELKMIRIEAARQKLRLEREVRQLLAQTPRDEPAIRERLRALDRLRIVMEQRRRETIARIRGVLTLEQQVRFAQIEDVFEQQTVRLIQEIQQILQEQRR